MTLTASFDSTELRLTLGTFATGVTVITTVDDQGKYHGITVNSFNAVSLDPPLILWSLALVTPDFAAFDQAEAFAVNILAANQVALSERFAVLEFETKFDGLDTALGLGGVPLLKGCAAILECRRENRFAGGDHVILLGRVHRIQQFSREPLIFCQGRYVNRQD